MAELLRPLKHLRPIFGSPGIDTACRVTPNAQPHQLAPDTFQFFVVIVRDDEFGPITFALGISREARKEFCESLARCDD